MEQLLEGAEECIVKGGFRLTWRKMRGRNKKIALTSKSISDY